jgi:hypothetical protein
MTLSRRAVDDRLRLTLAFRLVRSRVTVFAAAAILNNQRQNCPGGIPG